MGESLTDTINKRILVADDNEAIRIMLEDILSEAGYPVTTTQDGQETYNALVSDRFDLVILDLLMPQKSGFEILEWLKEQKKSPMVLVLTGIFKSPREIERLKKLGAKGYIYKSAPVEEILFRVNRVLFPVQDDTRKFPRVPVNITVEYRIDSRWHQAYSSTLGSNGLFIRTVNPPEKGSQIVVKFAIPERGYSVQVSGTVVWSNEYEAGGKKTALPGMGVKFEGIVDDDRQEIESFIQEQLSKEMIW